MKVEGLRLKVKALIETNGITVTDEVFLDNVIRLVKDRCILLTDFWQQSFFLFETPKHYDLAAVQPKWNEQKKLFFAETIRQFQLIQQWNAADLEKVFKEMAAANQIKAGDVLLPLRIMLVGGKFGPGVFDIAELIGKKETIERIKTAIIKFDSR
jgi:glutamyl-tRNA synthetase